MLPVAEAGKGDTWTASYEVPGGKADAAYATSDINDSTVIVNFAENSTIVTKAEMMGSEVTTTMKNQSPALLPLTDLQASSGKKINTESTGTTKSSFGSLPVTSRTTTVIMVRPALPQQ